MDMGLVYPELVWMKEQGINIWYDEGITPGKEWTEELGQAIEDADCFLFFISPNSVKSPNCRNELNFALNHNKQVLPVYLAQADLSKGLELSIGQKQAILKYELSDQLYRDKLVSGLSDHIQQGVAKAIEAPLVTTRSRSGLPWSLVLIGTISVVVTFSIVYWYLSDTRLSMVDVDPLSSGTTESVGVGSVEAAQNSIRSNWVAVLPFRTVAESGVLKELAEGITTDLISSLSTDKMFSVTSYGAVKAYRDSSRNPRQIATELGIRYLIEGRVLTSGEQTRIGVALVDGFEEKTLWDEVKTYQGSDRFEIQDDFTRFVNRVTDGKLRQFEMNRVQNLSSEDMDSWEHYLRGASIFAGLANPSQAKLTTAISELRLALELEPDHALSLASLSEHISLNTLFGSSPDRAASRHEACRLANSAIAINQNISQVMANSTRTLAQFCGEAAKAVQIGRLNVERFKNSGHSLAVLGAALYWAGNSDEALSVLQDVQKNFPNGPDSLQYAPLYKTMIYTERQEWENVFKLSRTGLNLDPANVFYMVPLANALGVLDRPNQAKEIWVQLLGRFPNFTIENYQWWLKQGLITDERVEPFVRGLKRAGVEE
jgi:TolB-like protein